MATTQANALALKVNGQTFDVLPENANMPLAAFIKAKTPFTAVKIACGEGGCGACTVAVEEQRDGRPHLRTFNSCLAPVYSLLGRSVLTAEGLPTSNGTPYGTSLVAERLSDFHASQCGYCTPGFTVACHAALHNAAVISAATGHNCGSGGVDATPADSTQGAVSGRHPPARTNGGNCSNGNGNGTCSGGAGGGKSLLTGQGALLRALDGNLCRCTGYRPIVAACRSLAEVADIEDLCGRLGATAGGNGNGNGNANGAAAHDGDGGVAAEVPLGPDQVLKVPRSLEQLVSEAGRLAVEAAAGCSWRLVSGHTGPGVYKDWPLQEAVLLSMTEVPELRRLEVVMDGDGQPAILKVGACATLEQLAAHLTALASAGATSADAVHCEAGKKADGAHGAAVVSGSRAAAATFGVRQWAAETSAHLYRIAGRHVRNVATVGGNLVLARQRGLPSDVVTPLAAVGAEVELVLVSADPAAHGSTVRADLLDFVSGAEPALPPGASYILTAARVPLLPEADPRVTFWSQRIAERYSNAAAVTNAAVFLRLSAPTRSCHDGEPPVVEDVRIVVGLRTPGDGDAAVGATSVAGRCFVAAHNGSRRDDATAVLLDGWRCARAVAAERALRNQPASSATVAAALEALAAADLSTEVAAAAAHGAEKAAAAIIAQGLVAQGLLECMGLVQPAAEAEGAAAEVTAYGAHDAVFDNGLNGTAANGGDYGNGSSSSELREPSPSSLPPGRLPPPALVEGRQFLPDSVPELLPVSEPVPKLGSKLQAAGTALYTEDVPVHRGALYGAFVLAARAGARLASVDTSAALALPGVVRFLGAADLPGVGPAGALNLCDMKPLGGGVFPWPEVTFLEIGARCEYAGQLVGVVLADSAWAAQRGAKAVRLMYNTPAADDAPPLLSIADAVRARSFYQLPAALPFAPGGQTYGDKNSFLSSNGTELDKVLAEAAAPTAAALTLTALDPGSGGGGGGDAAAPAAETPRSSRLRVVSGRYGTPSQLHFYMETQSAVAWPDEDGCVVVHSSCQGPDAVQAGVVTALQLPRNKVHVRCRRLGGGFGGKVTFARRVAVVAAIAAVATGRQVRITVPRNTDFMVWGGRCETDVSYVAVLEDDACDDTSAESSSGGRRALPRFRALDLHLVLQGGAFADLSVLEPINVLSAIDSVYDIPSFRIEIALARCNLQPRTAVRGPGEITATLIIEQVMEHVAAALRVDPEALREANFLKPQPAPAPSAASNGNITVATTAPNGSASGSDSSGVTTQTAPGFVKTSLQGKVIPARLFSAPYMWSKLQKEAGWAQIKAEVEAFNAANRWRKRGVAMIPSRYSMHRGRKPAYASLLADGTVQVATHGVEMGQGLSTKVAQVAAQTLSEVLPPSRRPLDLNTIRIADNSTELLPNSGVTGGSTTSEMACAAVRLACLTIVENLKKYAVPKMAGREDFGLPDLVAAVTVGNMGTTAPLSAFAWGGQGDLPEGSPDAPDGAPEPLYHVLGVALAVVEVDVLTGERRVLRSDVMFDLGRPVNPAVDMGQVEGAFVQGLGMMLQEEVAYDSTTGALLQNSTWNYKVPSVSCVPAQLNIHLLRDAPLATRGPVSSKACGEPPLLLSAVVLAALQRATAAARAEAAAAFGDVQSAADGGFAPLRAPATVERVRLACGDGSPAELLRRLQPQVPSIAGKA